MMSCNKYSVNKIYGKDHDKTEQTVLTTLRYFHPGNLYADSVQGGLGGVLGHLFRSWGI